MAIDKVVVESKLNELIKKGLPDGVASLDSAGLIPTSQLPSYVDDVLEYTNLSAFPATGEGGKIYVALDTLKTYRWSGTQYINLTGAALYRAASAGSASVATKTLTGIPLGYVPSVGDILVVSLSNGHTGNSLNFSINGKSYPAVFNNNALNGGAQIYEGGGWIPPDKTIMFVYINVNNGLWVAITGVYDNLNTVGGDILTAGAQLIGYKILVEGNDGKYYDARTITIPIKLGGNIFFKNNTNQHNSGATFGQVVCTSVYTEHQVCILSTLGTAANNYSLVDLVLGNNVYLVVGPGSGGYYVNTTTPFVSSLPDSPGQNLYIKIGTLGGVAGAAKFHFSADHPILASKAGISSSNTDVVIAEATANLGEFKLTINYLNAPDLVMILDKTITGVVTFYFKGIVHTSDNNILEFNVYNNNFSIAPGNNGISFLTFPGERDKTGYFTLNGNLIFILPDESKQEYLVDVTFYNKDGTESSPYIGKSSRIRVEKIR